MIFNGYILNRYGTTTNKLDKKIIQITARETTKMSLNIQTLEIHMVSSTIVQKK